MTEEGKQVCVQILSQEQVQPALGIRMLSTKVYHLRQVEIYIYIYIEETYIIVF